MACRNSWISVLLSLGVGAATTQGRADSSLPPSNPGAAVQLGDLDGIQPFDTVSKKFLCRALKFHLVLSNPSYRTTYYKFSIRSPRAALRIKMRETPDASLWFNLLDKDLGFLKEFRGGDDQLIDEEIDKGTYYLQLLSRAEVPHDPQGGNLAEITFSAYPKAYVQGKPTDPVGLGLLGKRTVSAPIFAVEQRQFPYYPNYAATPPTQPKLCPPAGQSRVDLFDTYRFDAKAGLISFSYSTAEMQNWQPMFPITAQWRAESGLGNWLPITGSQFSFPGGKGELRIGFLGDIAILIGDMYAEYTFSISQP